MKRVPVIAAAVLMATIASAASGQTRIHLASLPDTTSAGALAKADRAFAARRWSEAADLYESALAVQDGAPRHWLALAHALSNANRHREAIAAYEQAMQLGGAQPAAGAWQIARAYALDGNRKQALRWLAHATSRGFDDRDAILHEPAFEPYRDEPVFDAIVQGSGARSSSARRAWPRAREARARYAPLPLIARA